MTKIVVKQVKSQINCPLTQKKTLVALGLKRVGQSAVHDATSSILGQVNKVKHLVSVVETK